jgi:hypothetical protein
METGLRITAITLRNGHCLDGETPFLRNFSAENIRKGLHVYALAETKSSAAEALCSELLDTLGKSINKAGAAAFTTVLSEAYQACHKRLSDTLETEPLAARVGLGLTTLALRDDNVIFSMMGPGTLYLQDSSGARAVQPPYLGDGDDTSNEEQLLGISAGPASIRVGYHTLTPGQTLIAATSTLVDATSYDGLYAILNAPMEESVHQLELVMGRESYFAACLIKKSQV